MGTSSAPNREICSPKHPFFHFFFQEKILKISFIGLQEVLPGTCKVSPWITGTKNYRSSTVKDHEESDLYKMAVRASKPIELSEAGQSLIKLNELQRAQISKTVSQCTCSCSEA